MLVLTRRIGEQIVIDNGITVTVAAIRGDKVRLGINAPPSVRVDRSEVHERRLASHPAVSRPSLSSCLEGVTIMRTVQQGDRVQVNYVKRLRDGRKASSREPLQLTVGTDHPRLPGLGAALVGLSAGQLRMLTVPPELAYGLSDPARIHRWSRQRFPKEAMLQTGKLIHFTDEQGRHRRVRILEVDSKMVVVDANHPWAGQTLELEVTLLGFLEPPLGLEVSTAVASAEDRADPVSLPLMWTRPAWRVSAMPCRNGRSSRSTGLLPPPCPVTGIPVPQTSWSSAQATMRRTPWGCAGCCRFALLTPRKPVAREGKPWSQSKALREQRLGTPPFSSWYPPGRRLWWRRGWRRARVAASCFRSTPRR